MWCNFDWAIYVLHAACRLQMQFLGFVDFRIAFCSSDLDWWHLRSPTVLLVSDEFVWACAFTFRHKHCRQMILQGSLFCILHSIWFAKLMRCIWTCDLTRRCISCSKTTFLFSSCKFRFETELCTHVLQNNLKAPLFRHLKSPSSVRACRAWSFDQCPWRWLHDDRTEVRTWLLRR